MLMGRDIGRMLDPVLMALDCGITPDPWQSEFLRNPPRRGLLLACRQAGKTETCVLLALSIAHSEPGSLILVLSPSQRQSNEFIRRARQYHLRIDGAPSLKNDNVTRLEFENESRIIGLPGGDDGDKIRGLSNVRLLLVDEASRCSDTLVIAARAMLAVNKNGALIALSTPCGRRGFFFESFMSDDPDWKRIRVTTDMVPRISAEFLESERKALGQTAFESEYCLIWHDNEMSAFPTTIIDSAFTTELRPLWG